MIDDVLGAANIPLPIPLAAMRAAKAQYEKSTGNTIRPMKLPPNTTIPAVAMPRVPKRSESVPATGPEMRKPTVSGKRKMPAHRGVWL